MNMEELKLVIDALTSLGVQGKEAFIWWLILDKIPESILLSGLLMVIYRAVDKIGDL